MTVFLVGAGPGDPGLLTVRGEALLSGADVVVYDQLPAASLLDLVPPDAEVISVGTEPGKATPTQDEIITLLVALGAAGRQVVRLTGGDPFVSARGGEEAAALLAAGVEVEIVPGITSAQAGFERRPLSGKSVVVTRARSQGAEMASQLRSLGAAVVWAPMIAIDDPADGGAALARAVEELEAGDYRWVVLTSANGVDRLFSRLRDARSLGQVQVAAVGPGTARALRRHGVVADLVPEVAVGEGLVESFPRFSELVEASPGGSERVLLAQAADARDVVARGLSAKGWTVDEVQAYRSVPVVPDDGLVARIAAAEAVTFTSSSTVENLIDAVGVEGLPPVVASIGPITTMTLRERGVAVTAEASPHTVDGLIAAVRRALTP